MQLLAYTPSNIFTFSSFILYFSFFCLSVVVVVFGFGLASLFLHMLVRIPVTAGDSRNIKYDKRLLADDNYFCAKKKAVLKTQKYF